MTIDKNFDPAAIEAKWYKHWESTGAFRPDRPDAQAYTIVNPPPNVTGSLHIGHALDNTLQDILIRHARLQGKDALWVVGTDHAGIATQMVVERQMAAAGQKRTDFTRDEFIAKVWEWKEESGGEITQQLRRLGCSMDWENERFTMDEGFSKAVTKVFVDLYNQGLLYRDKRLVNWDPGLKTAISDLEVETREINGSFWHLRYPLADGATTATGANYIVVATTRPETMLADMAVAVNPTDERYAALVAAGAEVMLPITGRRVRVVADDHADPELGSGAVKITPGHDFNDFEVGKRAGFKPAEMLNMFDAEARVVQTSDELIPEVFIGMDRFVARKEVLDQIMALGMLKKVEDRIIQTPFGDRSGQVVEPWLTDQWYVDAKTLAGPAIEAVRFGAIDIVPKSWEKTYFNWMENIQPWCVSRQLWWGHRIPAWYGPPIGHDKQSLSDGTFAWIDEIPDLDDPEQRSRKAPEVFVAETYEDAVVQATAHYRNVGINFDLENGFSLKAVDSFDEARDAFLSAELGLWQDPDVLDTWFSSALWPFATLGWPALRDTASTSSAAPQDERYLEKSVRPELVEGQVVQDQDASPFDPLRASARTDLQETPSPLAEEERDLARNEPSRSGAGASAGAEHIGLQTQADPSPQPSPARGEGASLLNRHYPNDVLVSGFDILFFWDARMAMQGLHFMKEVPWKTLYLHGLVRAADGSKMSKSKGNTVDPLGLIDQYGADALRFFMAAMESQGRDIKMDESRVAGYRNFATKLWNAARFAQSNGIGGSHSISAPKAELAVNRWIIGEVVETLDKLNKAFAEFRFDGMADTIYHFVWDQFCDWYLELIKPAFVDGEKQEMDAESKAVAGWVLDQILVMLHPFMPFITEELWHSMGERRYDIILAKWPKPAAEGNVEAKAEVEWIVRLIREIRTARTELNVPPSARPIMTVFNQSQVVERYVLNNEDAIMRLARIEFRFWEKDRNEDRIVDNLQTKGAKKGAIVIELDGFGANIELEGIIDLDAERARIAKAIEAAAKERDALAGRLSNAAFVEKAKPEAVEKARADHAEKAAEAERLQAALARLG